MWLPGSFYVVADGCQGVYKWLLVCCVGLPECFYLIDWSVGGS